MSNIQGFAELDRKLAAIANQGKVKGLARNGIRAGQRVVVKAIKGKIPGKYKDARKAIGSSFKRAKVGETAGQMVCKIGAAVGIKRMSKSESEANKFERRLRGKKGVGISAQNIHWFILGTTKMTPPLAGIVKAGLAESATDAAKAVKQNIANGLAKLAK